MKSLFSVLLALCICFCLFSCGNNAPDTTCGTEGNEETDDAVVTPARVDILRMGKADCIVINTGSKIVMIDTGERENLARIYAYMERNGYEKIDMLILTHYDKDHIGGASEVITAYGVETVIESHFEVNNEWYAKYHSTLTELGIAPLKLTENYGFCYDSCEFEINVPERKKYHAKQDNNISLVISMNVGDNSFLFCGDAMELRLAELIQKNIGHYDFVKLPHHGTYIENYPAFLSMVTPMYAAITCSNKNPADESTLAILEEFNVATYQTTGGEINVSADGEKITIKQ